MTDRHLPPGHRVGRRLVLTVLLAVVATGLMLAVVHGVPRQLADGWLRNTHGLWSWIGSLVS